METHKQAHYLSGYCPCLIIVASHCANLLQSWHPVLLQRDKISRRHLIFYSAAETLHRLISQPCTPSSPNPDKSCWDLCNENSNSHRHRVNLLRSPAQEGAVGWVRRPPWIPGGHFLCSILCRRKARVLRRGRNWPWGQLAGYMHLVNAQYTSYTRMERIESSAVSAWSTQTRPSAWFICKTAASCFTTL